MLKKVICCLLLTAILLCAGCGGVQSGSSTVGDHETTDSLSISSVNGSVITYDYEKLYEFKNAKSDAEIEQLLALLQTPKTLPISFDSPDEDFLKITFAFALSLAPGERYIVNQTVLAQDITILFALLDDTETVDWSYIQADYGLGRAFSRTQMDEIFGDTIAQYGADRETFTHAFADKVKGLQYNPDVNSDVDYDNDIIGSHE